MKTARINILWNSNIIRSKEDDFNFTFTAIGAVSEPASQVLNTEEKLKFCISEGVIDFLGSVSRDKVVGPLKIADLVPLISTRPLKCRSLAIIEAMCYWKINNVSRYSGIRGYSWLLSLLLDNKRPSDFIVQQIVSILFGNIHTPTEGDVEYARKRLPWSRFLEKFGSMKDEY